MPISERAELALGMYLKGVDRFDDSRQWLTALRTSADDEGDESALPVVLGHLAWLECLAGRYPLALEYAQEGRSLLNRLGVRSPMLASSLPLVLAHLGHLDEARAIATKDVSDDEALGYTSGVALDLRSLGFIDLMAGDMPSAARHLLRSWAISVDLGVTEPAILRLHADAVEALAATAAWDDAERMSEELRDSSRHNNTPWATAMAGRCQGLIAAARGDVATALEHLEQAVLDHDRLAMPFEEARTRLLYGKLLRRAGHRSAARAELERALHGFEALGTPIQATQARTELAGISGRRAQLEELTAVEDRVAALVGRGLTNREVASELFISVRTVESHLGRIYRKRGVRSRTELAASLTKRDGTRS